MTLQEAITRASTSIARRDAEYLLLHILGRGRPWLLAHPEAPISADEMDRFAGLIARRGQHEPLQYLTGHQEFFGLDLHVTPDVLIPRPETELLVESVLTWAHRQPASSRPLRLVDVGTGSGAIALALAQHLPSAEITAMDFSPAALAVASANALRLDIAHRVQFKLANLLSPLEETESAVWDAVISNPPYVRMADAAELQTEVRDFEPHLALFAGEDGLEIYRRLIPQALATLRPGGLLALEFGFGQRPALAELLHNWHDVHFLDDLAGIPRVALGTRP